MDQALELDLLQEEVISLVLESLYLVHLSEQQSYLETLLLYRSVHPSTSLLLQSPKMQTKQLH